MPERSHTKAKQLTFYVRFANGEKEFLEVDNYVFTRISKFLKLKKRIQEVLMKKQKHLAELQTAWIFQVQDFFTGKLFEDTGKNSEVEMYWASLSGKVDMKDDFQRDSRIYEVVILQRTFRIWIFLARLRKVKATELLTPKTYAGETMTHKQKEDKENKERLARKQVELRKNIAKRFCSRMIGVEPFRQVRVLVEGMATMKDSPVFRFSKNRTLLETSVGNFELSDIYFVQIGLSLGAKAHFKLRDDKCLHLKLTGKLKIEIEASSAEDAALMYSGFSILRDCLLSMFSFEIKGGVPRRAVGTLIEQKLLNNPPSVAKATSGIRFGILKGQVKSNEENLQGEKPGKLTGEDGSEVAPAVGGFGFLQSIRQAASKPANKRANVSFAAAHIQNLDLEEREQEGPGGGGSHNGNVRQNDSDDESDVGDNKNALSKNEEVREANNAKVKR